MQYKITRAYPDGCDEDYRLDAFDVAGLGHVTIERLLQYWDAGYRFTTESYLLPAEVVVRTHPTTLRRYFTTLPDGYKGNNLSTLAHKPGLGALAASLARYR